MDLSIVIVNWNTCQILRDCLNSIFKNSAGLDLQVIVVDNASSDGSPEMVRDEFKNVTLLVNSENKGFAAANNQGIRLSRSPWILLLNSDTIVLENALNKALAFARFQDRAAVVGCRVLNPDLTLQRSCFQFPSLLNMFLAAAYLYKVFPHSRFFGRERMTWWNFDHPRQVDVVVGAFMLVRRAAIDQVGLMDETFFMYAEETDWCYRFIRSGWQVHFTPDPCIIHLGGQSSAKIRGQMIIQLRLSVLMFIRKHYSRFSYLIASVLVGAFFALRLPYWWLVRTFDKPRRDQAQVRVSAYANGILRALDWPT